MFVAYTQQQKIRSHQVVSSNIGMVESTWTMKTQQNTKLAQCWANETPLSIQEILMFPQLRNPHNFIITWKILGKFYNIKKDILNMQVHTKPNTRSINYGSWT